MGLAGFCARSFSVAGTVLAETCCYTQNKHSGKHAGCGHESEDPLDHPDRCKKIISKEYETSRPSRPSLTVDVANI